MKIMPLFAYVGVLFLGISHASNAATITGFEESEGFKSGTRTVTAGTPSASWNLTGNTTALRAFVSNARAKSGSLSWAMVGAATSEYASHALNTGTFSNSFTYSFTAPNTVYSSQATTSWVYVNLWDGVNGVGAGSIQLKTRYGTSAGGAFQLQYSTWSGATHSFAILNVAQSAMNFSLWNTLSVKLDYAGDTYSVLLNGSEILSNIALGTIQKNATTMSGNWLVSGNALTSTPGVYATTYYDDIAVVPEPSSIALLMGSVMMAGGWGLIRRSKSRMIMATR